MAEHFHISELYDIATDGTDWPKDLPAEERTVLARWVHEELTAHPPGFTMYMLYNRLRYRAEKEPQLVPYWGRAALFDFLYACVMRAARDVDEAEQRWCLKQK